jgi:hypothetical protein
MHLPTASLLYGKFHGVPEAFQYARHRYTGLWKESVVITGDEESDAQSFLL